MVPAAVAVLAAVVLAITGYLILARRSANPDYDGDGWDQPDDSPDDDDDLDLPPERSPEEPGFHAERFATDTDVRGIGPAMGAGVASHYPGLYSHPPQVPRIAPDIPEQCWCGHGPRGHLPAYVTEVLAEVTQP